MNELLQVFTAFGAMMGTAPPKTVPARAPQEYSSVYETQDEEEAKECAKADHTSSGKDCKEIRVSK